MLTGEMSKEEVVEMARHLVETTFRCLVDAPDEVVVRASVGTNTVIFSVSMRSDDKGRALGKGGSYKRLLEELLKPIGGNHGLRYVVDRID